MNEELKKKIAARVVSNLEAQGIDKEASLAAIGAALGRVGRGIKAAPGRLFRGIGNTADDVLFGMGRQTRRTVPSHPGIVQPGRQGGAGTPAMFEGQLWGGGHTGGTAFGKALVLGLGLGAAGTLIGAAGAAGQAGYAGIRDPLRRRVGFKRMMREEGNQWMQNEKESKLKKLHSTLYRFSPKMALDPLVSGAFMKKQLEFEDIGVQPNDLSTIANIEKAVRDAGSREVLTTAFSPTGIGGFRGLM